MSATKQYQLLSQGGAFAVGTAVPPAPGPEDVSIRLHTGALNPIDWKRWLTGLFVSSWPAVLGSEGAGVVEAVGTSVGNRFRVGDEVIARTMESRNGGSFQEVVVVPAACVVRRPRNLSPEDAAGLPAAFLTAASAVYASPGGLGHPLPFLKGGDNTTATAPALPVNSILVLGGSSGVGASAVQLLRMSLGRDATILTTCSPRHHRRLTAELGANAAFDQNSAGLVDDILAATPGGKGVDVILDTVGALAEDKKTLETLRADGPKTAFVVATGPPFELPAGVTKVDCSMTNVFGRPGADGLMEAMADLVEAGTFKLPYKSEVVGHGLESIHGGIEKLRAGVSGTKLVVKY